MNTPKARFASIGFLVAISQCDDHGFCLCEHLFALMLLDSGILTILLQSTTSKIVTNSNNLKLEPNYFCKQK